MPFQSIKTINHLSQMTIKYIINPNDQKHADDEVEIQFTWPRISQQVLPSLRILKWQSSKTAKCFKMRNIEILSTYISIHTI